MPQERGRFLLLVPSWKYEYDSMRKAIYFILVILIVVFSVWFIPAIFNYRVKTDEVWIENYQLKDGSYIDIVHSHSCKTKKPFFEKNTNRKMIDFYKTKYTVYDYCITEDDADMLNHISKRNIKLALEHDWLFLEDSIDFADYEHFSNAIDTTERIYTVSHSRFGGKLIPQN